MPDGSVPIGLGLWSILWRWGISHLENTMYIQTRGLVHDPFFGFTTKQLITIFSVTLFHFDNRPPLFATNLSWLAGKQIYIVFDGIELTKQHKPVKSWWTQKQHLWGEGLVEQSPSFLLSQQQWWKDWWKSWICQWQLASIWVLFFLFYHKFLLLTWSLFQSVPAGSQAKDPKR